MPHASSPEPLPYNPSKHHAEGGKVAIILPQPMTVAEIRVLQEFRRLSVETLPLEKVRNIKHPFGGGEESAVALVDKGYLTSDAGRENVILTEKAKAFLAIDYKPDEEVAVKKAESV